MLGGSRWMALSTSADTNRRHSRSRAHVQRGRAILACVLFVLFSTLDVFGQSAMSMPPACSIERIKFLSHEFRIEVSSVNPAE